MLHKLTPEIIAHLTHWATRPDASTDLRNIFGVGSHQSKSLLQSIKAGDFSWVPEIQILPAASMELAYAAYARETGTIYLSEDCPQDQITSVILEEIGHHIDTLFNEQETPGDEGALFSAAVRGITLSDEEITAILNEDDSAILALNGRQIAVECARSRPVAPVKPGAARPVPSLSKGGFQDSIASAVSYDHSTSSPAAHGLTLTGGGNLVGYGNSQVYNYLDARQNTGNSTLLAGPSNPAAKGPSSSTLWGGSGDSVLIGWSGPRTQNSKANASSGSTQIVLASAAGFSVGQYLGGAGIATGTQITKVSGSTLTVSKATAAAINGGTVYSLPVAASTTTTGIAAKGSSSLLLTSASQFYVGQIVTGTGIASGTTVQSVSGNTVVLSTKITAAIGKNATIQGFDSYTPPPRFAHNTDLFVGGAGNSTIYAGDVSSTLQGGAKNNLLIADTLSPSRTLGQSLVGGTSTSSLHGNTLRGGSGKDTLRSGTGYNTLISGSKTTAQSNTLLGGGISNSLVAGLGADSLAAVSGNSTLKGGTGKVSLLSGTGTNSLFSGSAAGLPGNGNLLNARLGTSNTLVAGLGRDTLIGGDKQNLLLVNQANLAAFANDSITLSTLASASNTLGISAASPVTINDSLLGTMASTGVRNLGTVANLGSISSRIILGANAQSVGVTTLVAGTGSDTLSVAGFTSKSALLDASLSVNRVSLVGSGGTFENNEAISTFIGSRGGYDTMIGTAGNDSMVLQASALAGSSFGRINGNGGDDTLVLKAAASLAGTNFNGVQNIDNLVLGNGNNRIGSLQGSGIQRIVGNKGSDTLSANVYGVIRSVTRAGSNAITLNVSPGTSATMGFDVGQVVTGNGIALGTTISKVSSTPAVSATPGTVTLTLSTPTTSLIAQGGAISGWINGATLDGSAALGFPPTDAETLRASTAFKNAATAITAANYGTPFELQKDTLAISTLKNDPSTYIHRKGDFLTSYGQNNLLIGGQGNGLPELNVDGDLFIDESSFASDETLGNGPRSYLSNSVFRQYQVVDNTLVSGAFSSNTLIGGSGANLYLINNLPGAAALPTIQNPTTLQSASTIQFTGNGVRLDDSALSTVSVRAAQKIVTANGNNLIEIGLNATQIGIQTIIGGVGSDTFITGLQRGDAIPMSVTSDALTGDLVIYVNDTSELSIGSLVTGDGIAESTSILDIDLETGAVTLSNGITQDLPVDSALSGTPLSTYVPSVYFDASRGSGNQSLASGSGNDTLLAGSGNATLSGGDGNNSLRGGAGNNLILSGVGNSTLDGGFGISTLQADGGVNRFIVRNRNTRILNPYELQRDPVSGEIAKPVPPPIATTPEVGIVDTYVNFDPILGSPVSQFDPGTPDNSPSITKSPSFASRDLSSFYNLQYFNLLGAANYGVGNALDNTMSAAAANALILGMGGNNTLVSTGQGSSLYGNSYANYASPDLYALAPTDTRTQEFVDGVMGVAGNNYLVGDASAFPGGTPGNFYLDGGPGYDDGLFQGSGSNTLIGLGSITNGIGGDDTVVVRHQADFVSLQGSSNTVITSVDLYQLPDNVSDLILNVTPQLANSGQVTFAGQRMTAGYAAMGDAKGAYTDINSFKAGNAPAITVADSARLQVAYGISDGTVYGSENVADANLALTVGTFIPDPKNPDKQAVTLSWTTPLTPYGNRVGQTMGYLVNYQIVAYQINPNTGGILYDAGGKPVLVSETLDADGNAIPMTDFDGNNLPDSKTPYLTYLKGTSQDLTGTSTDPRLLVDNLSTSFTDPYGNDGKGITYDSSNSIISYNFKVTAQETVLPAYTDADGNLIAKPVSLFGGQGNDVLYGGLLDNYESATSNTRPVLTNNPINPDDPGLIATQGPWDPTATYSGLFPTYLSGGLSGNDLLIAPVIGIDNRPSGDTDDRGSGLDFTAYQYINGVPMAVDYSGLNTLAGGQGSDTFVVSNGGRELNVVNGVVQTSAYDNVIKYGNETPVGQHNLVISMVSNLTLSDTVVNQGKFIDQAWAARGGQYIGGNRLDNSLSGYGGSNTLLGAGGRDSIFSAASGAYLIGGTAYGLDSIAGALANYSTGQRASIYRDTDPVPVTPNGPGSADNSQYWMINGGYDPLRNSDTLVGGGILDGGAGNDSMVGSTGVDTLFVSSGVSTNVNVISGSDIVVGAGVNGNTGDWIMFTGSDTYWSGLPGATTAQLGYALSNDGDALGGQSISNIMLQDGSPVARFATGNTTSTGNQHSPTLVPAAYYLGTEAGSNQLVGNEFNNTLNGGGVGSVGADTLTGHVASIFTDANRFIVDSTTYSSGSLDTKASSTEFNNRIEGTPIVTKFATDGSYAYISDFSNFDTLKLNKYVSSFTADEALAYFAIGSAPTGFKSGNIQGVKMKDITGINPDGTTTPPETWNSDLINTPTSTSTNFGIYYLGEDRTTPNLVAEIRTAGGFDLGNLGSILNIEGKNVDGTYDNLGGLIASNNGAIASNYLGYGMMYNLQGSDFADRVTFA